MRVFVSSTFQDMHRERDLLARWVFPAMRARCESRGVIWGDVDLRWGLTDEELAEKGVLATCLRDIEDCRPFFIGLLGDRYGWDGVDIPQHLMASEPWLASMKDASITEMEMVHGALGEHVDPRHAFIFLRDSLYVASVPDQERSRFQEQLNADEIARFGQEKASRRAAVRRERLGRLKERIRSSECATIDYRDPDDFKVLALEALTGLVDDLFPESSSPSDAERETMRHEAALWSLGEVSLDDGRAIGVYVSRPAYGERLDSVAHGRGGRLAILGEPGSGKSALIANWLLRYRQENPGARVVAHVVGASRQTSSVSGTLARLISELGGTFGGSYAGQSARDRAPIFQAFLGVAASQQTHGQLVVVVDGLDKLDDLDDEQDLRWLPESVPDNVCFVVATGPGRIQSALQRRGWPTLEIEPLERDERREVITRYLSGYRSTLEDDRVDQLVESDAAANPLVLRTVLDEVRVLGRAEGLEEHIADYLLAKSIPDLFERVLARCQRDYEDHRPHLVRDAVCFLWAAHHGLTEVELLDLLGRPGEPLPAALWSPVRHALGNLLSDRSGLLRLAHRQLREAVESAYLATAGAHLRWHEGLADYFETHGDRARSLEELPWQLERSEQWQRLTALISEPDALAAIGLRWELDLQRMWAGIERNTDIRLGDTVQRYLEERSSVATETLVALKTVSWAAGDTGATLALQNELALRLGPGGYSGMSVDATGAQEGDSPARAMLLRETADSHLRHGRLKKARELLNEAREMCERLDYAEGLAHCLRGEAAFWSASVNYERGLRCAEEACAISEALRDDRGLRADLTNRCGFLTQLGRIEEAKERHVREEALARQLEDWAGLARSLNNQGSLHVRYGDAKDALELFERANELAEQHGDAQSRALALCGQAHARSILGEGDAAFRLSQTARGVAEKVTNLQLITHCIVLQAALLPHFRREQVRELCLNISEDPQLKEGFISAIEGQLEMRKIAVERRGSDSAVHEAVFEYALATLRR